jgi:hypothetical protein
MQFSSIINCSFFRTYKLPIPVGMFVIFFIFLSTLEVEKFLIWFRKNLFVKLKNDDNA